MFSHPSSQYFYLVLLYSLRILLLLTLSWAFLYFLSYYSFYKLHFGTGIKKCTIKFSIELSTFQIDDRDIINDNI